MEDSFLQHNSLRSPSVAGGCWDEIPARSLGQGPSSRQQMKWIAETRSHRCFLSGRAVITPISFLKVVSLASQCEELCTVRFCVEPHKTVCWELIEAACRSCRRWTVGCHLYLDGASSPKALGFPGDGLLSYEQEGCQDYYPARRRRVSGWQHKAQCDVVTTQLTCRSSCFVTINPSHVGVHPCWIKHGYFYNFAEVGY